MCSKNFLLLAGIFCGLSYASTSLCPTGPSNAVPLNSFTADNTPPFGCSLGTTLFGNFNVVAGPNNTAKAPGAGDVFVTAGGEFPIQNLIFATPGPGPAWVIQPGDTLDTLISFTVQTGASVNLVSLSDPVFIGPNNQSGGSLTITESYCLGSADLSSCPAGQAGSLQSFQNGLNILSAFQNVTPANLAAIQVEIEIHNLTNQPFGLSQVPLIFNEGEGSPDPAVAIAAAPEPSLFLCSAAAILVFWRKRGSGR